MTPERLAELRKAATAVSDSAHQVNRHDNEGGTINHQLHQAIRIRGLDGGER